MSENHQVARAYASFARAVSDARTPWAVVLVIALALILNACALDRESLDRKRADLEKLCKGAITQQLRATCAAAGIDTTPEPAAPSQP